MSLSHPDGNKPQDGKLHTQGNNAWCHLGQLQYQKIVMKPPEIEFFLFTLVASLMIAAISVGFVLFAGVFGR